jgi:DTW domain-containing protein YfiP
MPRLYCPRCAYPTKTCVCHAIEETQYQTRVVVLQHPDEVKHAKNTARLISLVIPETEVAVGESAEDFAELSGRFANDSAAVVLFPTTDSIALDISAGREPIDTLIILDGTWRKARKMWLMNPWLHKLRVCHLRGTDQSAYSIRKTSVRGGMASIEAVAHGLELLEGGSTKPLRNALMAMQSHWPELLPGNDHSPE